ncbi:hypothetical protein RRG08_006437 [Elysia crispata]|uniref:Uncharacterized protein n=1 Tax=Elysia crispata TaxID=231223 RepID=A0AAE0YZS8_9GAST|nr:hypothetical protein RRG08_006437 [Elysia crispata]
MGQAIRQRLGLVNTRYPYPNPQALTATRQKIEYTPLFFHFHPLPSSHPSTQRFIVSHQAKPPDNHNIKM